MIAKSKRKDITPWEGIPENYLDYVGFVYKVVNTVTGKAYIGRKYFRFKRKRVFVESDWQYYQTSSTELQADISKYGIQSFRFIVLGLGKNKTEVNYLEVALQFEADVLNARLEDGSFAYYNKNIMSKYFQPRDVGTPEYEQKCLRIKEAIKKLYSNPEYKHPMLGKVHPNKGKKLPQTGHKLNKGKKAYNNGSINIVLNPNEPVPKDFIAGLLHKVSPAKVKSRRLRQEYEDNPKICKLCGNVISYTKRNNQFCSRDCANSHHSSTQKQAYKEGSSYLFSKNNKKGITK